MNDPTPTSTVRSRGHLALVLDGHGQRICPKCGQPADQPIDTNKDNQ